MHRSGFRGFPLFWSARAASQFGDQITLIALPWLIAGSTGSPLATGALEAVAVAPVLFLGLPLGAFADRRSRRRSMIQADALRFAALLTIPVVAAVGDQAGAAQVLIVAFVVGIGTALFEASAQPFLTDLVEPRRLVTCNARISLTEGLAEVVGPVVGGLLIAGLGASGAVGADATTFVISGIAILSLHRVTEHFSNAQATYRHAILEGLRLVAGLNRLRTLGMLQAGQNFAGGMVLGLLVIFLQRVLGLGGFQAGLVYAANGVGGVAAGLLAPRAAAWLGVGRTHVWAGILASVGFVILPTSTVDSWRVTATLGVALVGLGVVTGIISGATLRQRLVPAELLGRVTTAFRTALSGGLALGALTGGIVGSLVGVRAGLVLGALIYLAVSLSGFFTSLNAPDPPGGWD